MASYYGLGIRTITDSPTVIKELEAQDDVGKLTLFGCGLRSLRGLPPLRHLTELVLAANDGLGAGGVGAIARALRSPDAPLRRLDLKGTRAGARRSGLQVSRVLCLAARRGDPK